MLQFPFPPLLGPLSGTFRQNQSLNCFKKKKKNVYLWPLQGVWPALEIAPRSILSVIKALKSAGGWLSQIYSALNKFRGIFTVALTGFASLRSLLDGASRGDAAGSAGHFFLLLFFFPFNLFAFPRGKALVPPPPRGPRPSLCLAGPGGAGAGPVDPAAAPGSLFPVSGPLGGRG